MSATTCRPNSTASRNANSVLWFLNRQLPDLREHVGHFTHTEGALVPGYEQHLGPNQQSDRLREVLLRTGHVVAVPGRKRGLRIKPRPGTTWGAVVEPVRVCLVAARLGGCFWQAVEALPVLEDLCPTK